MEVIGEEICPECGSRRLLHDGEVVCTACGLVLGPTYDTGYDWRAFSPEEVQARARAGPPVTVMVADGGMTCVGFAGAPPLWDGLGHPIPARRRADVVRMARWQDRCRVDETGVVAVLREVDRLVAQMQLGPDTKTAVARLALRALDAGITTGRSIDAVVGAGVYLTLRLQHRPVTYAEVAEFSAEPVRRIAAVSRLMQERLGLRLPPVRPADHVDAVASRLGMSPEAARLAREMAELVADRTVGMAPTAAAAAAVYLAGIRCGERRRQWDVARAARVTEVTLRKVQAIILSSLREGHNRDRPLVPPALEGQFRALLERFGRTGEPLRTAVALCVLYKRYPGEFPLGTTVAGLCRALGVRPQGVYQAYECLTGRSLGALGR